MSSRIRMPLTLLTGGYWVLPKCCFLLKMCLSEKGANQILHGGRVRSKSQPWTIQVIVYPVGARGQGERSLSCRAETRGPGSVEGVYTPEQSFAATPRATCLINSSRRHPCHRAEEPVGPALSQLVATSES